MLSRYEEHRLVFEFRSFPFHGHKKSLDYLRQEKSVPHCLCKAHNPKLD
jgi:hypothetical protein